MLTHHARHHSLTVDPRKRRVGVRLLQSPSGRCTSELLAQLQYVNERHICTLRVSHERAQLLYMSWSSSLLEFGLAKSAHTHTHTQRLALTRGWELDFGRNFYPKNLFWGICQNFGKIVTQHFAKGRANDFASCLRSTEFGGSRKHWSKRLL